MVRNVGSLIYTHMPTDSPEGYSITQTQYLRDVGHYANTVYKRAVKGSAICQLQVPTHEF